MLIALLIMMSVASFGITGLAGSYLGREDTRGVFLMTLALILWCTLLPMWYYAQ